MASIDFYINTTGFEYDLDLSGSGLGFFGDSGFGSSVEVGKYQGSTFVTDGNGSLQGSRGKNIKYLNPGSGIIGASSSGIGLQATPNYLSTLNVRFSHSSAVKAQNCEMRVYDRVSINNPASGVTTKIAEIVHPNELEKTFDDSAVLIGSGDDQWTTAGGSGDTVTFSNSPGISGLYANGASTRAATRHDWFAAISASPDSIGPKSDYGLYFALEYL